MWPTKKKRREIKEEKQKQHTHKQTNKTIPVVCVSEYACADSQKCKKPNDPRQFLSN